MNLSRMEETVKNIIENLISSNRNRSYGINLCTLNENLKGDCRVPWQSQGTSNDRIILLVLNALSFDGSFLSRWLDVNPSFKC